MGLGLFYSKKVNYACEERHKNIMEKVINRLREISAAVIYAAEAVDLEVVFERIATVARELTNTRYAALGIPDGKGSLRYFKASGMTREEIALIDHLPRGLGLLGAIMHERRPIRTDCIQNDPRAYGFPENHPHMVSFLGVPVQAGGQLFGMLYLCDKYDGQPFNDEDEMLVETIAGYAALAIAGAELSQQKSNLELLEERQRIGMELHDGIIQSLYGIGMQIELMRLNNQTSYNDLGSVIANLNGVIEDIREYIMQLRRRGDKHSTIRDCLMSMTERLNLPPNVRVHVDAPNILPPFTPAVFESICLIVNEALSNAVRHANASEIRLRVAVTRTELTLEVWDNGTGFDVGALHDHEGLGLRNMQQRARWYGGTVTIDSRLGSGTRLHVLVPIRPF